MKLLEEVIHWYGIHHHQYADDTPLYTSTPSQISAVEVLAKCLEVVRVWLEKNWL